MILATVGTVALVWGLWMLALQCGERSRWAHERARLMRDRENAELTARARLIGQGWTPPASHPGYAKLERDLLNGGPANDAGDEEEHPTTDALRDRVLFKKETTTGLPRRPRIERRAHSPCWTPTLTGKVEYIIDALVGEATYPDEDEPRRSRQ